MLPHFPSDGGHIEPQSVSPLAIGWYKQRGVTGIPFVGIDVIRSADAPGTAFVCDLVVQCPFRAGDGGRTKFKFYCCHVLLIIYVLVLMSIFS